MYFLTFLSLCCFNFWCIITDCVRSTREGYVLMCLSVDDSVCPHVGGVPRPGPGRGVPLPGPAREVPRWGYPTSGNPPIRPGWGGTPLGWVPHLRYPPVRPGWGIPWPGPAGGIPHLGYPPSDLTRGVPHLGYPSHQTWPGVPHLRSPLPLPPSDLARGYPTSGTPPPPPPTIRPGREVPHLK